MSAIRRRTWISAWGIASLVLLLGDLGFREYNSYLHDRTGSPLIPWFYFNQICAVVMLAAAVCGLIAMRRGSKWWGLPWLLRCGSLSFAT